MSMKMFSLLLIVSFFVVKANCQSYPKMSSWDGVAYAIKDFYNENANDPKSIKYVESSLMMKFNNGLFSQRVKIRGKNAYNATILSENYFILNGSGDNVTVEAVYNESEFQMYVIQHSIKIVQKYQPDGTIVP